MSIVGPRPERPEIAAEYEKEMPEFRLRLQARAGLTGYAQVYGKYNTTPYALISRASGSGAVRSQTASASLKKTIFPSTSIKRT